MLVLKRRINQRVRIRTPHGSVWVMVTQVGPGWARLGIEAPDCYAVEREELLGGTDTRPANATGDEATGNGTPGESREGPAPG